MPTPQLFGLIVDHSVVLVALMLAVERVVYEAQPFLDHEWFYFSQRFLDVLERLPIPKIAAATLVALVFRSVYHLAAFYLQ